MLKFGIRQAGGCGRRPKNAKPTTKPNVQTQKKGSRPPKSPRGPPEAPGGTPQAPGGSPHRGRPPQVSEAPQNQKTPTFPGGGLEIWDPPGRGCGRKPKNPKPTTKPNVQTQKKGSNPGPQRPPRHHRHPQKPRPRRPPDGFGAPKATTGKAHNLSGRSRKGIEALETRPWIKARQIRGGVGI